MTFEIKHKNIAELDITLNPSSFEYDGTEKRPDAVMEYNGNKLVVDTDFTISYKDNVKAGEATATITGKGNYTGSKEIKFTITSKDIDVTVQGYTGVYDGAAHGITLSGAGLEGATVTYGETEGTYNMNVAPTYKDVGEYTVYFKV